MKKRRNENSTPSRMLVALLANWMTEGNYSRFIRAVVPRVQADLVKGAREIESRQVELPKWEPTGRHLTAGHPKHLLPMDAELVQRAQSLVGDLEVDLDAPLSPEDE